jgi:hypothetical protein
MVRAGYYYKPSRVEFLNEFGHGSVIQCPLFFPVTHFQKKNVEARRRALVEFGIEACQSCY